MLYEALVAGILLALMLLLNVVAQRRIRRLGDEVERQRRQIEVLEERMRGPPPAATTATTRPATARFTPRGTQRLPEPSPHANKLLPEPSPRAVARLPDPSPRAVPRVGDPSPRSSTTVGDSSSPRGNAALAEGGGWAPTHRITFTPERGRGESWLVMVTAAPAGGRAGATKAEWSAGVDPAWQCGADGAWTYRAQRTPNGAKGTVKVEPFAG